MQGLMLHAGGKPASFEEICGIEIPQQTPTYTPVAHGDLVRLVEDRAERLLGVKPLERAFGLARDGAQLFGCLKYPSPIVGKGEGISIGLRNSYDGSLSVGVALGLCVFVCDNLAFSAHDGAVQVVRKHTGNVMGSIHKAASLALLDWEEKYRSLVGEMDALRLVPCDLRAGYQVLGVAYGEGILTPQLASVAFREWRAPSFEAWKDERTLFGVYQATTHALKEAAPSRAVSHYTGAHQLFLGMAGIGTPEPADAEVLVN